LLTALPAAYFTFNFILLVISSKSKKTDSSLVGTILFVASDSLIAIHKFGIKISRFGFWVMSTYIFSQSDYDRLIGSN